MLGGQAQSTLAAKLGFFCNRLVTTGTLHVGMSMASGGKEGWNKEQGHITPTATAAAAAAEGFHFQFFKKTTWLDVGGV